MRKKEVQDLTNFYALQYKKTYFGMCVNSFGTCTEQRTYLCILISFSVMHPQEPVSQNIKTAMEKKCRIACLSDWSVLEYAIGFSPVLETELICCHSLKY